MQIIQHNDNFVNYKCLQTQLKYFKTSLPKKLLIFRKVKIKFLTDVKTDSTNETLNRKT